MDAADPGTDVTTTAMLTKLVTKLEREEKARSALVLHSENIPEKVLKDAGIKVHAAPKFKCLAESNAAAFTTGVKDGKEYNLNQQALQ
jgi:hypothetical protein